MKKYDEQTFVTPVENQKGMKINTNQFWDFFFIYLC